MDELPDWDFEAGDDFDNIIDDQGDWNEWTLDQDLRFLQWRADNPLRDVDDMTREEAIAILDKARS